MNDPNERRVFTAIAICLALSLVWMQFFAPKPAPPAEEPVAEAPAPATPGAPAVPSPAAAPSPVAEAPCVDADVGFGTAIASLGTSPCGAGLQRIQMEGQPAPLAVTPWWTWIVEKVKGAAPGGWVPYVDPEMVEGLLHEDGALAYAGAGDWSGPVGTWAIERSDTGLVARRTSPEGLTVTQTFRSTDQPDVFDVTIRWEGSAPVAGPLWVGVTDHFQAPVGAYDPHPKPVAVVDGDLYTFPFSSGCGGGTNQPVGPVSWFGVQDRYFLAALAPADPVWGNLRVETLPDGRTASFLVHEGALTPGAPAEVSFTLYAGAKAPERLQTVGHDLDDAANLGMFGFFSRILLFVLHLFHAALSNWGLSIIALTFTVRLLMYPLARAGFRSAKAMQAIQPKLKELQERLADDKEAQTRETMKLFQENGVNPMGGCLPIFIQIPVFWALYSGLQHTPDLYHAQFLYLQDLSMPDPYGLLPTLMAIGMILQQRMTPMTGVDPAQAQMMKLMPYMFALFMFGLPSGLSLYYSVNTGLAILQQWYNTRSFEAAQTANARGA